MASSIPVSNEATNTRGLRDPYLWHKLHSLSGILPIGIFLMQHLIANSYALRGPGAFETVVKVFGYLPFVAILEIVIIYIPILYHGIYGIFIAAHGQQNLGSYSYGRNWMYFLQRISGVIAFFYIGFHVWNTSLQRYFLEWQGSPDPGKAIGWESMAGQFADPLFFAFYVIGITATVFHFANGIWNFCIRWGVTISPRSQKISAYVCAGIFAVFTLIGLATANRFRVAGLNHERAAISAPGAATKVARG
ncbi:succinate dehydrogenase cytochrome B558 [Capsulimonas corticalis]|uniref:Succinate dehydrogenase cytochrome B558 n=1 Tax=Capsulimonas corticalis TaxID=2219043 RepID=A0A402CQ80_9BACT|nr:succinate dehydrogenase cytochrome b558 subunit [Capsulimonas corticalis]BDI32703.1 succinate dehydrogenase cytochrome B558 [Capsulimonas corticalis]